MSAGCTCTVSRNHRHRIRSGLPDPLFADLRRSDVSRHLQLTLSNARVQCQRVSPSFSLSIAQRDTPQSREQSGFTLKRTKTMPSQTTDHKPRIHSSTKNGGCPPSAAPLHYSTDTQHDSLGALNKYGESIVSTWHSLTLSVCPRPPSPRPAITRSASSHCCRHASCSGWNTARRRRGLSLQCR